MLSRPKSNRHFSGIDGNSYEFALETYLDSTRLKMRNESTKRTTYFDATKQVYYDESNHFLPTPDTTGFAP